MEKHCIIFCLSRWEYLKKTILREWVLVSFFPIFSNLYLSMYADRQSNVSHVDWLKTKLENFVVLLAHLLKKWQTVSHSTSPLLPFSEPWHILIQHGKSRFWEFMNIFWSRLFSYSGDKCFCRIFLTFHSIFRITQIYKLCKA